jgi:hypothetical protein
MSIDKQFLTIIKTHNIKTNGEKINVVLDFDNTLVNFEQLRYVYNYIIGSYENNKKNSYEYANSTWYNFLDDFPEIFRPRIFDFLNLLIELRHLGYIHSVVLYTNNLGGKKWIDTHIKYIETKCNLDKNVQLFNDVIYTYKNHKDQIVDNRRTSSDKIASDLYSILGVDANKDSIIFIDDQIYPEMQRPNIEYIKLVPFQVQFTKELISERFSNIFGVIDRTMYNTMTRFLSYVETNNQVEFCSKPVTQQDLVNTGYLFKKFTSSLGNILIETKTASIENQSFLNNEE